jgi:hypothetical protein
MRITPIRKGLFSLFILAGAAVLMSCASTPQIPQTPVIKSEGPYAIGDRGPAGGWIIMTKGIIRKAGDTWKPRPKIKLRQAGVIRAW